MYVYVVDVHMCIIYTIEEVRALVWQYFQYGIYNIMIDTLSTYVSYLYFIWIKQQPEKKKTQEISLNRKNKNEKEQCIKPFRVPHVLTWVS